MAPYRQVISILHAAIALCACTLSAHAQQLTSRVCGQSLEGFPATATCPPGMTVVAVNFSSFGLPLSDPTAPCAFIANTSCSASASVAVVRDACLGKASCSVPATVATFGSLSCPTVVARNLAFSLDCAPTWGSSPASVAPSASPSTLPNLGWTTFNDTNCYGADVNAMCSASGVPDAVGLTLERCLALCEADPTCAGITFTPIDQGCRKKCASGLSILPSPFSICSMAFSRLTRVQQADLLAAVQNATVSLPDSPPGYRGLADSSWPANYLYFIDSTQPTFYTVPAGHTLLGVGLWGAGGGSMTPNSFGGAGAFVTGNLPVTPGETLRLIVGAGGAGRGSTTGQGGGGSGFFGSPYFGSSGGGRSAIQRLVRGVWVDIVSAGGGGGSCYSYSLSQRNSGGSASWTSVGRRGTDQAVTTAASQGGGGGSLSFGGAGAGGAPSGSAGLGGGANNCNANTCRFYSAGGGGGAYGGGASYNPTLCGGGGGGSSLTSNLLNAYGETASVATPDVAGGRSSRYWTLWTNTPWLNGPGDATADGLITIYAGAPCDASLACYIGLTNYMSLATARSACQAIGSGWSLAQSVDSTTAASVNNRCFNTLPGWQAYWTAASRFQGDESEIDYYPDGDGDREWACCQLLNSNRAAPPPPSPSQVPTPSQAVTATQAVTPTRTPTPTETGSRSPTQTRTGSVTVTSSETGSQVATGTQTKSQVTTATQASTSTQSGTPTVTETGSVTLTPSLTRSQTVSPTLTASQTLSGTPTETQTPSVSATQAPTRSGTATASQTSTGTPSQTQSGTQTGSGSQAPTPSSTETGSQGPTRSSTGTPSTSVTSTQGATPSSTASISSSLTQTSSQVKSGSQTQTGSLTATASETQTVSPSQTETGTVTQSASQTQTGTPSQTATETGTSSQTQTRTQTGSASQTQSPTPSQTETGSQTRSPSQTQTGSLTETSSQTQSGTQTGTPSASQTPSESSTTSVTGTTSQSGTSSLTLTASQSPTPSVTATGSRTGTSSQSGTVSQSRSASQSGSETGTHTQAGTVSQSQSPSVTGSPSQSATPSLSSTGSATVSGTQGVTTSQSGTQSQSASLTSSLTPTQSQTPSPSTLPPPSIHCGLWGSSFVVTRSGSLLVTTPLEVLNHTAVAINIDCHWQIIAPVGATITLSFLAFYGQLDIDYLSVFDGPGGASPPLLTYQTSAGAIAPPPITSSGNQMYVWFQSTDYLDSKGVVAMVTFSQIQPLATPAPVSFQFHVDPPVTSTPFRCGPLISSGYINASGSTIDTDPLLPADGSTPVNIDCSVTISAPPDQVVALTYVNYSLANNLDYWSVFDGSSAAATPLTFLATGPRNLPPVLLSSSSYLYVRFLSTDFAVGAGRGVSAVVTFLSPPRQATPTPTPTPTAGPPLPLACTTVGMGMRPWNQAPNPQYVLGVQRTALGQCSQSPATINVSSLAGQWLTLGYQDEGSTTTLKDGISFQATLTSCYRDCNRTDPPISAANSRLNYPDKWRPRQTCGFSGLCTFLWALTDASGALLFPPQLVMATPFQVPRNATFLTIGYSQINYCSTGGSVGMCVYGYGASSSAPSSSPSPTPSPTPSPSITYTVLDIAVSVTGADGAACLATPACTAALSQAISRVLGPSVTNVSVVAAGVGPTPNASSASSDTTPSRRMATAGEEEAPRVLQIAPSNIGSSSLPIDAVSQAIFSSFSKAEYLPLNVIVQGVVAPASAPVASGSMRRALLQNSSGSAATPSVSEAAAAALAAVQNASESGALTASFAATLSSAINADQNGIGSSSALQKFSTDLNSGKASTSVTSASVNKPAQSASASSQKPGLSGGAIAGIVIAVTIFVFAVAAANMIFQRKRAEAGKNGVVTSRAPPFDVISVRPVALPATHSETLGSPTMMANPMIPPTQA